MITGYISLLVLHILTCRRRHHSQRSMEEEDDAAMEDPLLDQHYAIEVQGGNFTWHLNKEEITLKDISVRIPTGKLTVIVGQVGSGKSSLLSAFLGEMIQVSGNMFKARNLNVAYVSQRPWLLNASLKDNILFGKPFVWRKYKKVISACALLPDIEQLPAADITEIGEKGVNLSGGQKQRVSIARALYSEGDTVLLDDPLSALDSHVGKHVMEEAILRRMVKRNRTVILVTHHVQYLTHAHQVIVMANGHVHFQGKVGEVKKFDPDLYDVWRKAIRDAKATEFSQKFDAGSLLNLERKHSGGSQVSHDTMPRPASTQSQLSVPGLPGGLQGGRKMSAMSVMTEASNEDAGEDSMLADADGEVKALPEEKGKLIKQEFRETGAVKVMVYLRYLQSCSISLCLLSLFLQVKCVPFSDCQFDCCPLQIVYHSLIVTSNIWLSLWASDSNIYERNMSLLASTYGNITLEVSSPVCQHCVFSHSSFDNTPYLMTYIYLSLGAVLATFVGCLVIYYMGFVGSKNLFVNMLVSVIHLPMRFFDTNPSGRILNRFSADIVAIDQRLGGHVENLLRCTLFTISAVLVNSVTTPYFLFAAVPFFILYYFLQRFFRATARELQRLDSVTKSPIFSHTMETLSGLPVIRAYGVQSDFKRRAFKAVDCNVTPFLFIHTANRWLGIRLLDAIRSACLVLLVFISCITYMLIVSACFVTCITYTLMVSGQLNWIVRISTEVEMSMNAVERVLEYADMEKEPSIVSPAGPVTVPESWPSTGRIEFRQVSLSYAPDEDLVLHHASFLIEGGEKIGICGRTGSGKTSATLALFRMLDIIEGTILIDELDITRVDLSTLRSRLAIIPQDPVLFTGSLRFNLDPNKRRSDERLWSALESVQLKEFVAALPDQLDSDVVEGGENFSVGQRQLLCMARAFLCDSNILIMDEATASIDTETDNHIQAIIHSPALQNKTIITIAHRLSSIINYDRVMVLEFGEVKEFASPRELLADVSSIFYSLVHSGSE
ncbi:unnamed protein product [Candidula unifasciata]|uniref:Uncharacterized protein n=1 Tax=Candidula unifasciata TaxID=100452 RepID=A0A8S3Z4E5_9EUPU|nr:unnamed protein product [Candidula unifasciata]